MNLAKLVLDHARAVWVLVVLLCCAGVYSLTQVSSALFPSTDFPRIAVQVDNGVIPADQMAVTVTRPLEEALSGVLDIRRVKSVTSRGASEVNLFFDWKADMVLSLQLVQARLGQLKLPPGASIRRVERLTFAAFPVCGYSLTSDKLDQGQLRQLAQYTIRPRLARLSGVASVGLAGGKVRELHVVVDPHKLTARRIGLTQISDALRTSNLLDSPGLLEENHTLDLVLVSGLAVDPAELKNISVGTINGLPVKLGDVAQVVEGVAPDYTLVSADAKRAVVLNILRQPNADILGVTRAVREEIASLQAGLPAGTQLRPFYDQSTLVQASMSSVRDAIGLGLLLSVLVLYGFLRDWNATLVAVLVVPVTLLATVSAMHLAGLTFDLMTLGGMAAAIGLVIDDAIVMVENIHTHLSRGQTRSQAVLESLREITGPLIGSTLTPVVVFAPLSLLSGITGVFFRSLATTLAVSLLTSLALALLFTPVVSAYLLRPHPQAERKASLLDRGIEAYCSLLRTALARPLAVLAVVVALLFGSHFVYGRLGSDMLPSFDEGGFVLDYVAPPGTSLSETDRMLNQLESYLRACPEIESYSRRTGLRLSGSVSEPNQGDFLVKLKGRRQRSVSQVTDGLRLQINASLPALRVSFAGILSDLIGDLASAPQPVEVRLFSEDRVQLFAAAQEVARLVGQVPGVVDVFDGIVISGPALTFRVDPEKSARLGISAGEIARAVSTALQGDPASALLEQDRLLPIRVLYPRAAVTNLAALQGLLLRSSAGGLFRLDQVAQVEYQSGQTQLGRDGLRQSVAVTARLSGLDLGSAIAQIQDKLKGAHLKVGVEYGGLYAEQQRSFQELTVVMLLAITLVFLTLVIEFRSFIAPIAIVTGAILSLSGVLLGLYLTNTTLNVVSLMGMVMVVGIVAKNGILMLDTVDTHLQAGDTVEHALLESGRRRFRPVLMTSLAAVLGMLPLALAIGAGSELLQPLAIAVIGGLSVALLFSLVVTPSVFAFLHRLS
ncbi:hypothetical protein ABS71_07295 [bacterium SCN 62-11]|nr:efflux RND transporter permease subunit [Candidatus Eremiobacteraeota bacterium]ODT73365.1 MAG: hypothetical protein ABS71_07295 [bacterium SCN 62-11]